MRKLFFNILGFFLISVAFFLYFLLFIMFWIGNYNTRLGALLSLRWCDFYKNTLGRIPSPDKVPDPMAPLRLTAMLRLGTNDPQIWKRVELTKPRQWNQAFHQCVGYFIYQGKYQLAESVAGDWIERMQQTLSEKEDDFYAFVEKYGTDFSDAGRMAVMEKQYAEMPEEIKGFWARSKADNEKLENFQPYFYYYHAQIAQGIARWILTQNPIKNKALKRLIREEFVVNTTWDIHVIYGENLALRLGMSHEEFDALHASIVTRPAA